jgi:hypothetical protein
MNFKTKLSVVGGAVLSAPALVFAQSSGSAPSAGNLSSLTPDATTLLTAIAAVTAVTAGVYMAIKAWPIIKRLLP